LGIKLVAQNQNQVSASAHGVFCAGFMRRQASEQYSTLSQFLAHALRQLMGLAHTAQGLLGKKDLLPLNPVSAGFWGFIDVSV
jgi:hypothetical protein